MSKHWNWKRFLLAIALVALVAVMAFGAIGSAAWFTDTGEILGNEVTTGELDILVEGGPLVVHNLEPGEGYVTAGYFHATNDGDYDMKFRGWLDNVDDPDNLRQYLEVKCIMNPGLGYDGSYGPTAGVRFTDVPFASLMAQPNTYILLDSTTAIPFPPTADIWYELQVRLLPSAPNAVQNAQLTARLYLEATQWINTGWSE